MVFPPPAELLPHRPPMLLLRRVLSHAAGETCCEGGFDPRLQAACDGEVSAAFGLEMIAQAAAVHHALVQLQSGAGHVRAARGLLLGSRRLWLAAASLSVSEPLWVTVQGAAEPPGSGGMIRFTGRVAAAAGGRLLVSGDVTVLEMPADEAAA